MPPFGSPLQIQNARFTANSELSYLTGNMSLNNNNHSPPASTSGGQSPEHNSPQSPTLSRVDRTASRYAMVNNTAKQNGANKNMPLYSSSMEQAHFDNAVAQQPQGLTSPWATKTASNQANASLPGQASENNFSSTGAPFPTPFDPSALGYALAIQQAMLQPGPQTSQLGQPGQLHNPIDFPQTVITERALQSASSYAFYRGNGQYTRLVPLDELPPIAGLQPLGPMNGMIILPIPRQHQAVKIPMWSCQGPLTPGGSVSTPSTGGSMNSMTSGRHFDAFAPLNPATGFVPSGFGNRAISVSGGGGMRNFSNNTPSGRREKIYCDKWVHDGVCAFAQQGCKYKHEMPLDVPTQRSLGLFHGLPSWWKREHGLEMKRMDGGEEGGRRSSEVERQREVVRESLRGPPGSERGTLNSWRLPVEKRTVTAGGSALAQNVPRAGGLFGNIGSRTTSTTKSALSNAFSVLDVEDPTSPVSSNGVGGGGMQNNGGIAASMHAPFSPTAGNGHIIRKETNGNGQGGFVSKEAN